MSIVGPRPEQVQLYQKYNESIPYFSLRQVITPGLTGWAQINQGYAHGTKETKLKLCYDLYYLKHFSVWLDIIIIYRTLKVVLLGIKAR